VNAGNDRRQRWRQWRTTAILSSAGLTLAAGAALGFLVGYLLDQRLHTSPWLVLVPGTLGVVAGFRQLIRALNRVSAEDDEDRAPPRRAPQTSDEAESQEPGRDEPA